MIARILCVEDEPELREDLVLALSDAGYEVAEAGDGEAALNLARAQKFDLIVCDLQLPRLSGLDMIRRLRGDNPNTGMPHIIVLTAFGDSATRQRAEALHPACILTKPIDYDDLITLIAGIPDNAEG